MKKKILLFGGIFLIIFIVSYLFIYYILMDNLYNPTIITSLDEYSAVFDEKYFGKRIGYNTQLFPKTIKNLDVQKYSFVHKICSVFGTEWQIAMDVKYDNDSFSRELDRIEALCKDSPIYGESYFFDSPAYATVWNSYNCFEYAIIDEENSQISYVYLQLISPEKITIDKKYIPRYYKMVYTCDEEDTGSYSIY